MAQFPNINLGPDWEEKLKRKKSDEALARATQLLKKSPAKHTSATSPEKKSGLIHNPGGRKLIGEMNMLERKIMGGKATDAEKKRWEELSGSKVSDLKID